MCIRDSRFPKMPSYLRRAAIQHALGSVSSYETRMDLWEKSGEKAGKPRLAYENHAMPVFYRDVMYREEKEGKDEADVYKRQAYGLVHLFSICRKNNCVKF